MIKELSLTKVRLMEFFQVMSSVKSFLEQEDLATLKLETLKTDFDQKLELLDQALKPQKKSSITEQIHQIDDIRSRYLVGFVGHCRAFTNFPTEAKRKSAKQLLLVIEKYGKSVSTKPLQEKTGIIVNLLDDLKLSPSDSDVRTIGATDWITELKKCNEQFIELYNTRTKEQGAIEAGKTRNARKEMADVFYKLIRTINALGIVDGEEPYLNLANNLNEVIRKARA